MLVFIGQTTHQPSAEAGNFARVEGESLCFGHFDGDPGKIGQIGGATTGPSAGAKSSFHFGLVPDPDLPKLNADSEIGGQILDQLPEVHAVV